MTSDPKTTAMKAHSQPEIIARIDARLKALGVSEKRAMLVKALPEDRIRRLRQGTAPRLDTLEEVAFALDLTLGQMLGFEPIDEALPSPGVQLGELDPQKLEIAMENKCWDLAFVYIGGGAGPEKLAAGKAQLRNLLKSGWEPFSTDADHISLRKQVRPDEVTYGAEAPESVDA